MIKYSCDICGREFKDTPSTTFTIPVEVYTPIKGGRGGGTILWQYNSINPTEVHLCIDCQKTIASLINTYSRAAKEVVNETPTNLNS